MKNYLTIILSFVIILYPETLFEVKDSSNNPVLNVSTDGLRVMNEGDTLMVISSEAIRANIGLTNKGLSRAFSVTTTQSKGKGLINALEVNSESASMTSPLGQYTNFSPENIFLGLDAGVNNTPAPWPEDEGKDNVFIGNRSGNLNTTGFANTYVGMEAGRDNQTSFGNSYFGSHAGEENTEGGNTFIGVNAGRYGRNSFQDPNIGGGSSNTFVGYTSGQYVTGDFNTCLGMSSGVGIATGEGNVYLGHSSGYLATDGSNNVYVGKGAGYNGTGSDNVFIGKSSGYNGSGSGNVFIGMDAGHGETGSYKLYIDNSSSAAPLVYGDFLSDMVRINGDLDVTGSLSSGTASVTGTLSTTSNTTVGGYLRTNGSIGIGKIPYSNYALDITDTYLGVYSSVIATGGSDTYGIFTEAYSGTLSNNGIYATAAGGTNNWAGYFSGSINVTGSVVKSADVVKVDHPLDPKNKVLTHSSVSSDQMINIYSGNAVLDSDGKVSVEIPEWVEYYNAEFRYQLTAVGGAAPDLHIAEEVKNGIFKIAGGKPGMKVSWEITGIRNDNYAKQNPVEVEKFKTTDERGFYINPEAYGFAREYGIDYQKEKKIKSESLKK